MANKITHIIWDCDGCLIDSEIIACRVAAEFYTQAGYPMTTAEFIRDFAGKSKSQIKQEIEAKIGTSLEGKLNYAAKTEARIRAFEQELQAIEGVHAALESLSHIPMAIASGSDPERLEHSLKLTDLWQRFAGHVYSSSMVKNGKPAPDVFLLAAEKLGAKPENCVVIEDAHHGVHGAKAAGMLVLGFTGSSHGSPELAARLTAAGADHVFSHMSQLPALIESLSA